MEVTDRFQNRNSIFWKKSALRGLRIDMRCIGNRVLRTSLSFWRLEVVSRDFQTTTTPSYSILFPINGKDTRAESFQNIKLSNSKGSACLIICESGRLHHVEKELLGRKVLLYDELLGYRTSDRKTKFTSS